MEEGKYPASGGWRRLIPPSRDEIERLIQRWKEYNIKKEQREKGKVCSNFVVALMVCGIVGLLIFAITLLFQKF